MFEMVDYGLSEEIQLVFSKMDKAAYELYVLSHEEDTVFSEQTSIDSPLSDAYFFYYLFDEEMLGWSLVFDRLSGSNVYAFEDYEKDDIDGSMAKYLRVLLDGVTTISGLDLDREQLASAYGYEGNAGDFNPFRVYGFEELADKLRTFVEAFDAVR